MELPNGNWQWQIAPPGPPPTAPGPEADDTPRSTSRPGSGDSVVLQDRLGLGQAWYHDRGVLQDWDLFNGRLRTSGLLMAGMTTSAHDEQMRFLRGGAPGTIIPFAYLPIWRIAETNQVLDELEVGIDADHRHFLKFNGKGRHGTWIYEEPYLDVQINVRFGEPAFPNERGTEGKWVRFQNIPGTLVWMRCEPYDNHTWVVFMAAIITEGTIMVDPADNRPAAS